jgi:alpha,alpha-trehalase
MTSVTTDTTGVMYNISRACTIFCEGPVLETVQLAEIYNDSKTFVDMPMIYEPEQVMTNFNAIVDKSNITQLVQFLNENFLAAGSDLTTWIPPDYQDFPPLYKAIPNDYPYKTWFLDLNNLWLTLGRNISDAVVQHPEKHSFLPRPYPMVVPGGRFRESYYWDSYWTIRGLLVCSMNETAYYIIKNLLSDVENFGFVPNGGRIYYLDRSQPPLLSEMVISYYNYMIRDTAFMLQSSNREFLEDFILDAYDLMQTEYRFWMNSTKGHVVQLANPKNSSEKMYLNRYYSNYTSPRPESYVEDYDNSLQFTRSPEQVNFFYHSIRGGAETGWDFSSRWILGYYNISYVDTIDIVPVELNSYLYRYEINLAKLTIITSAIQKQNNNETVDFYFNAAKQRYRGIQTFLWDNESFHWRDFNITSGQYVNLLRTNYTSIAYWIPLWAGIYPNASVDDVIRNDIYSTDSRPLVSAQTANNLVGSLLRSGLIQPGGVLTTNINTGQQWDAPNAWPPLVSLTIDGLKRLQTPSALSLAVSFFFTFSMSITIIILSDKSYLFMAEHLLYSLQCHRLYV